MQDLTTGSLTQHLLKTTGFMLVMMIFQTLYYLVDLYWVGHLGKESVAAVGLSGNLMFVVLAVTQMLGVGTTALIAHATGRKDHAQTLLIFNQSLVLSAVGGAIFIVVGLALRMPYANGLSADPETAAQTASYLLWFIPAMGLQFGMAAMGAALRGTGNFKPGMVVSSATIALNIVLAPVFIFGWGTGVPFGVAGAAVSTLVSIAVGTVWLAFYFLPADAYLRFVAADWKPRFDLWRKMLSIGLPAGAEFGIMSIYLVMIYFLIRPFGAAAQAGFGVGIRIVQACFMPVVALGFAVAPVAGQNFGAGQPDRVRATFRAGVLMATGIMVLLALVCHIAPAAMIAFFTSDPAVIAVGDEYLRIASWNFVASGVVFVSSSMFQAMGNTIPSLVTSFTRLVLFAVPAFMLAALPGFGLRWLWYLGTIAVTLQMVMNLLLLRREYRLRLFASAAPMPAVASVPTAS